MTELFDRSSYILYRDDDKPPLSIDTLSVNPDENTQPNKNGTGWEQVWYYIKESPETQDILRVELYWPMPFIKVGSKLKHRLLNTKRI